MNKKIDANILKQYFADKKSFSAKEVFSLYSTENKEITMHNIYWLIHSLCKKNEINRVSRGIYSFLGNKQFTPYLSAKSKSLYRFLKKQFPYTDLCVWELSVINMFAHNLINFNIYFVDIERIAVNSAFYFLKEKNRRVFNVRKTGEELVDKANFICVRPLITQSPLLDFEGIKTASLEKILVDLYSDKEFLPFQGNEIGYIFESAFEKNAISEKTMLRYASRKRKTIEIDKEIETIKSSIV